MSDNESSTYTPDGYVMCTHNGKDWHNSYPTTLFCHECNLWEAKRHLSARAKRSQNRYACKAHHTSTVKPTHMNNKIWVPRKQANQIKSNREIPTSMMATNNTDNSTNITTVPVQEI